MGKPRNWRQARNSSTGIPKHEGGAWQRQSFGPAGPCKSLRAGDLQLADDKRTPGTPEQPGQAPVAPGVA